MASVCCEAFVSSALIVQTGKPWKRLGWANLGSHRGTLQTTFQAIHAHAIQQSLVNWTSTFPGWLKKHMESTQVSMPSKSAASWKLSKRMNQKLFWKASNCQLCRTAPQHHIRSCGQRWPLPPPCCLVGKVYTLLTNSHHWRSQQDTSRRWHQCPSLQGVQAKQKKM